MAVNVRDVLVVVRARDVASRVFREVGTNIGAVGAMSKASATQVLGLGTALTGAGLGLVGVGALGISAFNSMTNAAIDYSEQVALTFTQVDNKAAISFEQVSDLGKKMAAEYPIPFEEAQSVLFDVFSSIEIEGIDTADALATAISKAATAGGSDLQQTGRAIIATLNSMEIPIENVNDVLDWQFQLVRKGIIDYDELTANIGKILPAANLAGQGIDDIGGALAFITRSIPDAAMASTALSRSFELFAHPKFVERVEDMGIAIRDSEGNFNDFNTVIQELGRQLDHLPEAEKAERIFELMEGAGGTRQARRFMVEAISDWETLGDMVNMVSDDAGAADEAFGVMWDEPASKLEMMNNQFEILRVEIGERLIPIKLKLAEIVKGLLDWWNGLSEGTQDLIVKIAFFGSVAAVAVGIVLTLAGVFLMLAAAIMFVFGVGFVAAIAIMGLVIVGIAALAAAAYLIITNWDTVKEWVLNMWDTIKEKFSEAWAHIKPIIDELWAFLKEAWQDIQDIGKQLGEALVSIWEEILETVDSPVIQNTIKAVIGALKTLWKVAQPILLRLWNIFKIAWDGIVKVVKQAIRIVQNLIELVLNIIQGDWEEAWDNIKEIVGGVWDAVIAIIETAIEIVIQAVAGLGEAIWQAGEAIRSWFTDLPGYIVGILNALWDEMYELGGMIIKGLWDGIKSVWNAAWSWLKELPWKIVNWFKQVLGVASPSTVFLQIGKDIIKGLWDGVKAMWKAYWAFWTSLPGKIIDTFKGAVTWLFDLGMDIITGLWDGIKAIWNNVTGWLGNVRSWILDKFAGAVNWLYTKGREVINGLLNGMKAIWGNVTGWLAGLSGRVLGAIAGIGNVLWDTGARIIRSLLDGMKNAWNEVTGWLGGLGGAIVSLKGPPAHDAQLLTENGQLIMDGLQRGLESGWGDVANYLSSLDPSMAFNPSVNFGAGTGMSGGAGTTITVQEGAVQINIEGDVTEEKVDQVSDAVQSALDEVLREWDARHGRSYNG